MTGVEFNADLAMEQYHKRVEENKGQQVDNSSLPAGAPMYYYCGKCRKHVATLPEGWFGSPPPRHCDPCQVLVDHGLV